jgi:hypothetical protein
MTLPHVLDLAAITTAVAAVAGVAPAASALLSCVWLTMQITRSVRKSFVRRETDGV